MKKRKRSKKGQTMMEYVVLVVLLAIGSIPVIKILGDIFRNQVMSSAEKMVGSTSYKDKGSQLLNSGDRHVRKDMKNFHED